MEIILIVVVGFVAGVVAEVVWPGGTGPWEVPSAIGLGIGGTLLAALMARWMGWYGPSDVSALFVYMGGAASVLLAWQLTVRRWTPSSGIPEN